jgi:phosphopantothenate-cysteine ligase/phosphopantothenoylcysteine decarboxylase/phosphopantothenate--cysteine ligase
MKVLVTTGNTQTPIDRVRCITNIFSGRTGTQIALEAHRRGHAVTLVTSHPEVAREMAPELVRDERWTVRRYRTFDDLETEMATLLTKDRFDALIHAAAVSDYELAGLFVTQDGRMTPLDTAGKVKSSHPELWLQMKPTPKLADRVRSPWGFQGVFVKFKLEVRVSDAELRTIAETSRRQSDADLIVANTLDGMGTVAFIGDRAGMWEKVPRRVLAARLLDRVETPIA